MPVQVRLWEVECFAIEESGRAGQGQWRKQQVEDGEEVGVGSR